MGGSQTGEREKSPATPGRPQTTLSELEDHDIQKMKQVGADQHQRRGFQ